MKITSDQKCSPGGFHSSSPRFERCEYLSPRDSSGTREGAKESLQQLSQWGDGGAELAVPKTGAHQNPLLGEDAHEPRALCCLQKQQKSVGF